MSDFASVLDRFLRYVTYDTQSDERSTTYPSTDTQLVLLRALVDELRALGLDDAAIDDARLRDGDDSGHHAQGRTCRRSASSRTSTRRRR